MKLPKIAQMFTSTKRTKFGHEAMCINKRSFGSGSLSRGAKYPKINASNEHGLSPQKYLLSDNFEESKFKA